MAAETIDMVELTAQIVSNYVSNNSTSVSDVPALITAIHAALEGARSGQNDEDSETTVKGTPAQIKRSITPDALISFEDGKPYKTLRRHLTTRGLTAAQYKEKWGLPSDYPMTARAYSQARSTLAKALGLGRVSRKSGPKARAKNSEH